MAKKASAFFLINALAITTFLSPAAAWEIGDKDENGYWFLYEEPIEGVYTNTWWGKQKGSSGSEVDVSIRAEGKTADFSGVLHIYCNNNSHAWKSGRNFDSPVPVDQIRDLAPNKVITWARI